MGARPQISSETFHPATTKEQLRKTLQLIGQRIRSGSSYPPIRNWAAAQAATAEPKDYMGQARAIYNAFVKRWRYVRDPLRTELVVSSGPALWSLVFGADSPTGYGFGDCDESCAALGAAAMAVGWPVRLTTSVPPGGKAFAHVYPEVQIPRVGWIPFDAVTYPKSGFGTEPAASHRQRWTLDAEPINATTLGGDDMSAEQWHDYGLDNYGLAGTDGEEPAAWATHGIIGFGAFADDMGTIGGLGLLAEVVPDAHTGLARTPMIEVSVPDFDYIRRHGKPYHGMLALGDDGTVYQYDGVNGFFSSLFKGAKSLVSSVWKGAKGLISKIPGGKYLVRFVDKIHNTAMKLVAPLLKIVGPLALKVAPIAAIVPGFGPAISAALYAGGTVSKILTETGVHQDAKGKLHFDPKRPEQLHAFRTKLHAAAMHERATHKLRNAGVLRRPVAPGHLPAGSPEAAAAMRAGGVRPMWPFMLPPYLMPGYQQPPQFIVETQPGYAPRVPARQLPVRPAPIARPQATARRVVV